MKRILHKINTYKKEHTLKETIQWLYNAVLYKVSKKKNKLQFEKIPLTKKEKENVVLKTGKKVFIFGNIPYYDIGGGQRSSQLAKAFSYMGYPVYYIYGFSSSESKKYNIPMPMVMHLSIDSFSLKDFQNKLEKDDLCIFEAPCIKYSPFIDIAIEKKAKIVYENIDNWETSLGNGVFHQDTLEKLLTHSDLLVGTAKPLVEQLKKYCKKLGIQKNIVYLANAVDDEMFFPLIAREKPADLVQGENTLLYYGSLWGNWFDWDLIFELAKKRPQDTINLIGDDQSLTSIKEKAPQNVHFLGLKKQSELPNYLAFSDYALIPFKVGEIGDYVSPLKIFEYISMYKKVLTTCLPDIQGYPNTYCGNTANEWSKAIDQNYDVDKTVADDFIATNSWFYRISNLLDFVYDIPCPKEYFENISIVILNYNNKGIIDRCVDSLLRNNRRYHYSIIVVDNQSSDGSYEILKEKYPMIQVVRNHKNGCSSGRNLGVQSCKTDYILFLDSDQWAMHPYWLDPYFEVLKLENVGLIGWTGGWFNKAGAAYHVVDSFPYRYMPQSGLCRKDIGYLGSGGMIISKKLFEEVDGFDEAYDPTCYEDTDLSLKVRNVDKEIYYCPYLGIMHLPHQTTKSGSKEHTELITKKQIYFTNKWKSKNPKLLKYIK